MFSGAVTVPGIAHQGRSQGKCRLAVIILLVLSALTSSPTVGAQTSTTGEITGAVTDPAGAWFRVVP
jgi:hypothetical protein